MEDKIHFFKRQKLSLWNELKNSDAIQDKLRSFYVKDTIPTTKTINIPSNICKIYVTLIGGGGSGSLGEYRRKNNSLEDTNVDTGYLNVLPLPGSGGGGGATVFRLPIVFLPKRRTVLEYEVGQGGEGRSITILNNPYQQDSQQEKEYRTGRSGTESKMIIRQYGINNTIAKEIKLKAMGGGGGGAVGYFTSRSDILNMDSSMFQYVWDWSAVSDHGYDEFRLVSNWPKDNNNNDLKDRYQYWSSLMLDPNDPKGNKDSDGNDMQKSEHFSVAAEHFTAITEIPSYLKVAFHQELRYPISEFKNDYIAYNLLTHGVDGISRFEILKPDSVVEINGVRGYFGNNITQYGNYEVVFPLNSSSDELCFNLIHQYQPLISTLAGISISKANIYRSQGQPLYYLRNGTKYYYKDRSVAYRSDLTLPFDYPLREKMYVSSSEVSLTLPRWSPLFKSLVEEGNGPIRPFELSDMVKGDKGAFGGAGGGFIFYNQNIPLSHHGLYGGKKIEGKWGIPSSGSGGNPYPRMITNAVDLDEFNRFNAYEGSYYYYGGMGYLDANSNGEDTLITTHFIPGSGGGSLDYLNTQNYISNRRYTEEVDLNEKDPEVTEGRFLKTYDGIFKWHVANYNKQALGGKIKYINQSDENLISKLYTNLEYGKHDISLEGTKDPKNLELQKDALLLIFGGGGGGGKAFYFSPGDGQESIFMDPSPAGIGCGSGGSSSMNEDGKSVVKVAPYGTVNWYLNKIFNNPEEMIKYYNFGYDLYVTAISTIVGMIVGQILLSIVIEVVTFGIAGAVSGVMKTIKTTATSITKGISAAIKATKYGVKIINAFSKVSQWFAKIGSKLGVGLSSKIKSFLLKNPKLAKIVKGFKTFGSGLKFIGKKIGQGLAYAYKSPVGKVIRAILGVVLFNDWSFIFESTKYVKAFKAANKIQDIARTIAKFTDIGGELLEQIPKLKKKITKLQKVVGKFGDLSKLKLTNPLDYQLYNWFNAEQLFIEPYFNKVVSKIENNFKNYIESTFDVTAKRLKELDSLVDSKYKLFAKKLVTKNVDEIASEVVTNINKDIVRLKNLGEKRNYVLKLKEVFGTNNISKLEIDDYLTGIVEQADLIQFGKYQPNVNLLLKRIAEPDLKKLSINERRELIHNLIQRTIGDGDNVAFVRDQLDDVVQAVRNSPLTYSEQGKLLSQLYNNNLKVFSISDATTFKGKYKSFESMSKNFILNPSVMNKVKKESPHLFLYLKGAQAADLINLDDKVEIFLESFNLQKYLVDNPDIFFKLDPKTFDWSLFPKLNITPSSVDFQKMSSEILNKTLNNKKLLNLFVNNPDYLTDSSKFGEVFKDAIGLVLEKASKDENLARSILKNLPKYGITFNPPDNELITVSSVRVDGLFQEPGGGFETFRNYDFLDVSIDFKSKEVFYVLDGEKKKLLNGIINIDNNPNHIIEIKNGFIVKKSNYFTDFHSNGYKFASFTDNGDGTITVPSLVNGNPQIISKNDFSLGVNNLGVEEFGIKQFNVRLLNDNSFSLLRDNLSIYINKYRDYLFAINGKINFNGIDLDQVSLNRLLQILNPDNNNLIDESFKYVEFLNGNDFVRNKDISLLSQLSFFKVYQDYALSGRLSDLSKFYNSEFIRVYEKSINITLNQINRNPKQFMEFLLTTIDSNYLSKNFKFDDIYSLFNNLKGTPNQIDLNIKQAMQLNRMYNVKVNPNLLDSGDNFIKFVVDPQFFPSNLTNSERIAKIRFLASLDPATLTTDNFFQRIVENQMKISGNISETTEINKFMLPKDLETTINVFERPPLAAITPYGQIRTDLNLKIEAVISQLQNLGDNEEIAIVLRKQLEELENVKNILDNYRNYYKDELFTITEAFDIDNDVFDLVQKSNPELLDYFLANNLLVNQIQNKKLKYGEITNVFNELNKPYVLQLNTIQDQLKFSQYFVNLNKFYKNQNVNTIAEIYNFAEFKSKINIYGLYDQVNIDVNIQNYSLLVNDTLLEIQDLNSVVDDLNNISIILNDLKLSNGSISDALQNNQQFKDLIDKYALVDSTNIDANIIYFDDLSIDLVKEILEKQKNVNDINFIVNSLIEIRTKNINLETALSDYSDFYRTVNQMLNENIVNNNSSLDDVMFYFNFKSVEDQVTLSKLLQIIESNSKISKKFIEITRIRYVSLYDFDELFKFNKNLFDNNKNVYLDLYKKLFGFDTTVSDSFFDKSFVNWVNNNPSLNIVYNDILKSELVNPNIFPNSKIKNITSNGYTKFEEIDQIQNLFITNTNLTKKKYKCIQRFN